jgi:hypothetical protein
MPDIQSPVVPAGGWITMPSNAFREQVAIAARWIAVGNERRASMPVLILWAVPAVFFVGGVGYFLIDATH